MSVEFEAIFSALAGEENEWQVTPLEDRPHRNALFRASNPDPEQPDLVIKRYAEKGAAEREYMVLEALRHFGINFAPEPLELSPDKTALIMSWLDGDSFAAPPALDDEDGWRRLMAALGAASELMLEDYRHISMQGRAYMRPGDLLSDMDVMLKKLGDDHLAYEQLATALENAHEHVAPDWNYPVGAVLCRCDQSLHHFMLEGCCHILSLDWARADWGDIAAEVGLWSAHPDFEEVPVSHWAWVRWEFARLKNMSEIVPRATIYGRLGVIYWALKLAAEVDERTATKKQIKQRDRYIKRAERVFV